MAKIAGKWISKDTDNLTHTGDNLAVKFSDAEAADANKVWSSNKINTISGSLNTSLNTHINDTSNPHNVTAAQTGALVNIIEDTTPQLGGNLDVNGNSIGNTGSEISFTDNLLLDETNGHISTIVSGTKFGTDHEWMYLTKSGYSYINLMTAGGAYYDAPVINFERAQGTIASPTLVGLGNLIGGTAYRAYDGNSFQQIANIYVSTNATTSGTAGNIPNRIWFYQGTQSGNRIEFLSMYSDGYMDTSYDFLPKTSGTVDIGSSALPFAEGHFDTLYGDGSNLTNITAASTEASEVEYFTTTSGNISDKYVTLAHSAYATTEVSMDIIGGCAQEYGVDYTVSGAQVSWSGLGLDGVLEVGDKIRVRYTYTV